MSYRIDNARVILGLACLIGALAAPSWVPLIFAIALVARYRAWEVVGVGIFMDLVWLPHPVGFAMIPYATIIAFILVVMFEPLRRELLLR